MNKIRKEIEEEIIRGTGKDPYEILSECIEGSTDVHYFPNKENPLAIFGIVPINIALGIACPWLITFEGLSAKDLLRSTKVLMKEQLDNWNVLVNYVDAEFKAALRWAKWAGFEVGEPIPYGPNGELFCMIVRSK